MADAAHSTPASDGQFALTVADLNTTVDHDPRVQDIRLAAALGMDRPRDIRKLIERHRAALERLGGVCATVAQTSRQGGRPGRISWLNKRQALYLCTKSETPRATEATIQMVEVFDAHLAGQLAAPSPALPPPDAPSLLPGPDALVSTQDLAAAIGRRHKHLLRLVDQIVTARPELLDRHIRFATFVDVHSKQPYRCFHLDRVGVQALMERLHDARSIAVRAATLARFAAAVPSGRAQRALAAPKPRPSLAQEGQALFRIGGETVLVDTTRFEPGEGERAVFCFFEGGLAIDEAVCHYPHQNILGRRVGHVLSVTSHPDGRDLHDTGWVIGTVIEPRRTKEAGGRREGRAALPAPREPRRSLGPPRVLPDLAQILVAGAA